jgi:outer membrane protein TolC
LFSKLKTELAQAEQSMVQAEIGYQLALTAVDHATGTLLDLFRVQLAP